MRVWGREAAARTRNRCADVGVGVGVGVGNRHRKALALEGDGTGRRRPAAPNHGRAGWLFGGVWAGGSAACRGADVSSAAREGLGAGGAGAVGAGRLRRSACVVLTAPGGVESGVLVLVLVLVLECWAEAGHRATLGT